MKGWFLECNLGAYLPAKSLQSCPTLCNPVDRSPPGSSVHGDSPGKNAGMGCHAILPGIFPTQGSNPCLLCLLPWQVGSLPRGPPVGSPVTWVKPPQIHMVEEGDECEWREGNCWLCPGASRSCLAVRINRRDAPQAWLCGGLYVSRMLPSAVPL